MRPVSAARVRPAGFTLVEAMVALAVFAILLALGMPRMADWVAATRAAAAGQFYVEGFTLARAQALAHNSASRLVLVENEDNGQYDWRVDLCFPTPETPCNAGAGDWSTVEDGVKPAGTAGDGFVSVARSSAALPASSRMRITAGPDGASAVYFTPLGWVDTRIEPRLMRIDLDPVDQDDATFAPASVVLTLAGVAAKCDPNVAADDSRRCPE